MLHGRSGDEDVMWAFAPVLPEHWLIVAPRGIVPDPDGGYAWHPRKRDEWPALSAFDNSVAAVYGFIRSLSGLYDADPDYVYLMGFSQGAATAYATAIRHPGLAQGIAGLVGFAPAASEVEVSVEPLSRMPVFMAVGRADPRIPLERAEECARVLRVAGSRVEYRVYDTGHRISAQGMRDLKRWWRERQ
jgi:phospholipase/carboxylesterase